MPDGWYPHEPNHPFYELDWVFLHEHPPSDCRFGYCAALIAASPEVTDGDDSLAKVPDLCSLCLDLREGFFKLNVT